MSAWRFEYGHKSLQVVVDTLFLPGVKCSSCGQTWSLISHEALNITVEAKKLIKQAKRPLSAPDFGRLLERLAIITNDQNWMNQNPGAAVGDLEITSKTDHSKFRLLWSILGPVLLRADLVESLAYLYPEYHESVRWLPKHKHAELMTVRINLAEYGAKKICGCCGRLDYSGVDERKLIECINRSAPLSFFSLPYGPVFGDRTRLILEHLMKEDEVSFVPWAWC